MEQQSNTMEQQKTSGGLRVLFAGGGTGGHLYPALAIAKTLCLTRPGTEVLFVGTADRMEAIKVPAAGFPFRAISVHGLAGQWTLSGIAKRLRAVVEITSGLPFWQSLSILSRFRPDVVVGTGGYVCGPVLAAAAFAGYPVMLVEQNEEIGYTSRLSSRFINVAAVISETSGAFFRARGIRTEVVGNPVRPEILSATRADGISALGLEHDRLTLAILGGSLGSTPINRAMAEALRALATEAWFRDGWQVLHQTGEGRGGALTPDDVKALGITYTAFPFLDNIHDVLAASDVVVTRAGGTFLAEVAARGIPLVIIPWSGAANDHQTRNAHPFAEVGAAVVIPDEECNGPRLLAALNDILPDPARRAAMAAACKKLGHPESAERIIGLITELAGPRAASSEAQRR